MWVLIQEPISGGVIDGSDCGLGQWGLIPGQTYTVGRLEGEVVCSKDSSVSKTHARLSVISVGLGERPEVMLEDVGSKYGTHLNNAILAESQRLADNDGRISRALKKPVKLKDNDRMRFGVAYSIFRLKWVNMIVTSSMLKDKKTLDSWLIEIEAGTKVQSQWNETTTHLAMNNISLSIKVVNCLAKGVPIVTPEYFRDYNSSLKSKQKLPLVSDYTPPVSQSDSESQLRDPNISFQINKDRRELFKGKTLVFLSQQQHTLNLPPITLSGGTALLWTESSVLSSISPNHIVIQPPGLKNSQSQMTNSTTDLWTNLTTHLASLSLQSSPATHIYLAIVHSSLSNFCNPSRRPSPVFPAVVPTQAKQSYKVRAPETQSTMGENKVNPSGSNLVSDTPSSKGSASSLFKTPQSTSAIKKPDAPVKLEILTADSQTQVLQTGIDETQDPFLSPAETVPVEHPPVKSPDKIIKSSSTRASKRGRVSSDEDNLEVDTLKAPLAKKHFSQTTTEATSDIFGTGKENIVNNSSQFTEPIKDRCSIPVDDADILGLNSDQTSKKRVLSDTETVPIQSQEKRSRHSSGEDIFGFGEPSKNKKSKPFQSSTQLPRTGKSLKSSQVDDDEDLFGFVDEKPQKVTQKISDLNQTKIQNNPCSSKVTVSTSISGEDENQNLTSGSKFGNSPKFDTTGFLGKEDITIKSEVKTEYNEDMSGDVSALSASLVKVTLMNLLRPSTPKPAYVPSPNPELLGKPVLNFKKFKKQSVDKTRKVISLVKYVPSDLNQTGIDEWFNQNKDVTRKEKEIENLEKQSEDFWNFHNSQSQGKKRNPFSRK